MNNILCNRFDNRKQNAADMKSKKNHPKTSQI